MEKDKVVPPIQLFLLAYAAYLFLVFFFYRIVFFVMYGLPETGIGDALEALTLSLRLDLAAVSLMLLPLVLLSPLVTMAGTCRICRKLWSSLSVLFCVAPFFVCIADLVFYSERQKHLEEEFFMYWNTDIVPAIGIMVDAYPVLLVITLAAAALFSAFLYLRIIRFLAEQDHTRSSYFKSIIILAGSVVLLFFAVRGFHSRPFRSGHALRSDTPFVNTLAMNPVYTIFVDSLKSYVNKGEFQFYDDREALETAVGMIRTEGDTFAGHRYPFLRQSVSMRANSRKNVVILQLEGFSNSFIGFRRKGLEVTPFLNALAAQSLYFPYFVQNVRFTHRALFVINSSFLDRATGRSVLKSPAARRNYSSLPVILGKEGYSLHYFEGGDSDYESMRDFLEGQGYSIYDKEIMAEGGRYSHVSDHRNSFGFYDEFVFSEAAYRLEEAKKPFLAYIATHSTHSPWTPPDHFESRFESPFSAIEYADHALENFFHQLRESGLLENTVIVITADHTSLAVRDDSFYDRMNIPLLIYGSGLEGASRKTIGSQIDIMPTVLGILGLDVPYSSMGRNLIRVPEKEGFACSLYNGYAYWHEKSFILKDWFSDEYEPKLFRRSKHTVKGEDISADHPVKTKKLRYRLRSYYQAARIAILQDRVFPRPGMDQSKREGKFP